MPTPRRACAGCTISDSSAPLLQLTFNGASDDTSAFKSDMSDTQMGWLLMGMLSHSSTRTGAPERTRYLALRWSGQLGDSELLWTGVSKITLPSTYSLAKASGKEPPIESQLRPSRVRLGITAPTNLRNSRSSGGGGM